METFNARAELVKAWERLVRIGEQLREARRRLPERLVQEVESLRGSQDYVEGLYRKVYREGGSEFLMRKAADRAKARLEQRIQELPEAQPKALNRGAQSRGGCERRAGCRSEAATTGRAASVSFNN